MKIDLITMVFFYKIQPQHVAEVQIYFISLLIFLPLILIDGFSTVFKLFYIASSNYAILVNLLHICFLCSGNIVR